MYIFAENPIRSLKQLFTVTSVDRRYFCSQKGKWIGGIAENAAAVYKSAVVTHSPINFGGRSIDHNVLFCSLVFLPAAFDSIRGCGESIYLSRCHEPPVMDGGCSLTLTPKGEAVPRTRYPQPSASDPDFCPLSPSYFTHYSCSSHARHSQSSQREHLHIFSCGTL